MSIKFPTISKKFWIVAITLLVIGTLFAYYLLVYVDLREKKLRADKYRAVARYGENMINTRGDYSKAIEKLWSRRETIFEPYRQAYNKNWKTQKKIAEITQRQLDALKIARDKIAELIQETSQPCTGDCLTAKKLSSLEEKIDQTLNLDSMGPGFWNVYRDTLRREIDSLIKLDLPNIRYDGYFSKKEVDSLAHKNFDRIFFTYLSQRSGREDRFGVFSIRTSDFAYRPNQFDEFFIIKQFDESHYEHVENNVQEANETFQTFQNRIDLATIDSLLVKENGLLTSRFSETTLADTKYKLFVHSIRFSEGENWLLCGLMKTENFNNEIRAVSPLFITSAILIVLLLIVAMPILKLLIMNTYERLTLADVWLTGFSVVCGSALLFLMIWSGSHNVQSTGRIDKSLTDLSETIKANFQNEILDIYAQLDFINNDYLAEVIPQLKRDVFREWKAEKSTKTSNTIDSFATADSIHIIGKFIERFLLKDSLWPRKKLIYPSFNYVMFIKESGKLALTITNGNKLPDYEMPNLGQRKYFSWVKKDSTWDLPPDKLKKSRFALQSIQSWSDHSPEAGFGIRSSSTKIPSLVLAMSTRLHSIMDPALPLGYGFCIIDETGEVWFHSTTEKNHQENIFLEINNKRKLTAAVKARGKTHFSAAYAGHQNRLYVQPIDNIPLFLVMFHDNEYQRTPVVLTIFFAFGLTILLLIVQGVQLLALIASEYRSGKLKSQGFFLKVLRPDSSHEYMYRKSIMAQIVLLGISLVLYWWGYFATVLGFVTLPVMLMVFHQTLYLGKLTHRGIIFLILSGIIIVLLNGLAFRWLNDEERAVAAIQQLVFAFVLFLFTPKNIRGKLLPKYIDSKIKGIINKWSTPKEKLEIKTTKRDEEKSRLKKLKDKFQKLWMTIKNIKYPGTYYSYLMLWLILISLFPVAYFYKMAYWQESLLWAKYQQLEDRDATIKRKKVLDNALPPLLPAELRGYPDAMGNYLPTSECITTTKKNCQGEIFQEVIFEAWPGLPDPFGISSATSLNAVDGKWRWSKTSDSVEIEYDSIGRESGRAHYTSSYGKFNPFRGEYGFWFILFTGSSIFILARLIFFSSKYIFGIGIIPEVQPLNSDAIVTKIKNSKRIFITGLPGSGKSKLDDEDYVIRCFEMGINDHAYNQKKLAYIQLRQADKSCPKIVIFSAVQPSAIIEVYRKWISDARNEVTKNDSMITEYKIALRKWRNVMSDFEVYYMSIRPDEFSKNEIVNTELNACNYLHNLAENNKISQGTLTDEDFIMSVEEIAEPYYNALWNSFSQYEKLLLFDLAHDGFVNLKNQRTIRILMLKGVIVVRENSLAIMNKSFTNFILSVFREEEEIAITKAVRSKGAWQNIQLVLVLVLIAIVAFIALAQKELMSDLNAFIIALTGAFSILSRFGGVFGAGAKSKEK